MNAALDRANIRSIDNFRSCRVCGLAKPDDDFGLRSREAGVKSTRCRDCTMTYQRLWYLENREELIRQARLRRIRTMNENRVRAWRYLIEHPCVDCGERDLVILEFDHLREKRADISNMVSSGLAWTTIAIEIAKCEVRCVNCHVRKTAQRVGIHDRKHSFAGIVSTECNSSSAHVLAVRGAALTAAASGERICGNCQQTKTLDEFHIRYRATGERLTWCRACMAESKRKWYLRNREHQIERVKVNSRKSTRENQTRVWSHLGQNPCVDCGESDPVVLQFDHLRNKRKEVSKMVRAFTWKVIQQEIDKCEVRCANCHRRKTSRDQGFFDRKRAFMDVSASPDERKVEDPQFLYIY